MKKLITDHSDSTKSFERNYVYDQQEILAEHDESKVLGIYTHSMLRTDDVLAVDVKDTKLAKNIQSYFYLKNAIGTITEVVDSSGSLIQHYVYSSFGKILKIQDASLAEITSSPTLKTSYGFTNREHDEETGLMYYRARFMMPEIGKFLQEDPHPGKPTNPISMINKYSYSGNNPVSNIDPDGRFFFTAIVLGAAIFGKGEVQQYAIDIIAAAAVVGIIVASGGTAAGALAAVASTAGGAVAAAGASSLVSGGDFNENFHSFFRISLAFLAVSAIAAPGGIASAGGNGFQGNIVSNNSYLKGYHGGLTIGTSSTYNASSGFAAHEFGHTVKFIGIAAFNKSPDKTWEVYLTLGLIGTIPLGGYNPVEYTADILGGFY